MDAPSPAPAPATARTRVIAQNDEETVLYLHEAGSHVGRRSQHLVVTKHDREINRLPIASIRQVIVFGTVQVSTQTPYTLAEAEIAVAYLTRYGKFVAALPPAREEHGVEGAPVPRLRGRRAVAGPGHPGGRQDGRSADAPDAIAALRGVHRAPGSSNPVSAIPDSGMRASEICNLESGTVRRPSKNNA